MTFQRVASVNDLGEEETLRVDAGDTPVCLVKSASGEIFAVNDICTHEYTSMAEGWVEDCYVECPRHGSQFDARTGKVLSLPATEDLPVYAVRIEGDDIYVDVEASANA